MSNTTQHSIKSKRALQGLQDLSFLQRRRLTVQFDYSDLTIYINKSFVPPVSWFLTDDDGEMVLSGQIKDHDYTIDFAGLVEGVYFLRIAGEVHMIHHNGLC